MECKNSIGCLVSSVSRHIQIYVGKELEAYNIGSGQFSFLMRLYKEDGINQEALARFFNVDKATSARAIKKLMDEGYVYRLRDEEDRRAYRVFLTDKAKALRPVIADISSRLADIVLADFTEDEKRTVMDFLNRMLLNMSNTRQTETWDEK